MPGITEYSVYVPRYRMRRETIAAAWRSRAAPGLKAVRNYDEDALTMAYAAAHPLAPSAALYFASTSAPYWQRSCASQVAAACDLPRETVTADFGGSLRCGATALRVALAQPASSIVVASESRDGAPESAEELTFGDAAAAIRTGGDAVLAELLSAASRCDDFLDEWRRDSDTFVRSFASKYSVAGGYEANVASVVRLVLEQAAVAGSAIARANISAAVAKAVGIPPERLFDASAETGNCGAAAPLLALAHALDKARAGDLILIAAYGDGADALLFRAVSDGQARLRPEPRPIEPASYPVWRKLREYGRTAAAEELSNVLVNREESQNVRLRGSLCPRCGQINFPQTKVCGACQCRCGLTEQPLARRGRLFTFTKDYLYDAPVQPAIMAVIDLDGGGRFLCQMTDAEESAVEIGMEVELVLRRMRERGGAHHYYWKARPV